MSLLRVGSLSIFIAAVMAAPAAADVAITGLTTTVDFTGYAGEGFAPTPAAGQLDSDDIRVRGLENGNVLFGGTGTGAGIANGIDANAVTAGGTWAFDVGGGNPAFGWQPTNLNLTPGDITLRYVNATGAAISSLTLSYVTWVYNDQDRSNDVRFSYSTDDVSYTAVPSCTVVSPISKDAAPAWVSTPCTVTVAVAVAADAQLYLRWDTNDVGGMLNRDQLAIDDVVVAVPGCGDGVIGDGEACDDGNTLRDDGCDDACAFEAGWTCDGEPTVCAPICGDGLVVGDQACDDGNSDDTDACTNACQPATCGDGFTYVGVEGCDDGNTDDTDACARCQPATCGDGFVQDGVEPCDDGNLDEHDFCMNDCTKASCGDGLINGTDACDDGNPDGLDGCGGDCTVEFGWACDGEPSTCATVCGDTIVAGDEGCDDGGTAAGDGCDDACAVEAGWDCGEFGCDAICGDELIVGEETCDDGNTTPGDGCSATCTTEGGPDNDQDDDGILDDDDNCPETANADQADADDDGVGDACDDEPMEPVPGGGCCQTGTGDGAGAGAVLLAALVLGGALRSRRRRGATTLAVMLVLVIGLAACGGKTAATGAGGTGGGATGSGDGTATGGDGTAAGGGTTAVSIDTSKLGDPCEEDGSCPAGMACTTYFGFAGPSGPEFKSCEVTCTAGKGGCPTGSECVTIADGPGSVCRVPAP